jgi:hypothetical protein
MRFQTHPLPEVPENGVSKEFKQAAQRQNRT